MTREHAKELLPIITALANGEEIQHRTPQDEWEACDDPGFSWEPHRYRIAPKPRKVWVNEYRDDATLYTYPSKEAAASAFGKPVATYELKLPPLP